MNKLIKNLTLTISLTPLLYFLLLPPNQAQAATTTDAGITFVDAGTNPVDPTEPTAPKPPEVVDPPNHNQNKPGNGVDAKPPLNNFLPQTAENSSISFQISLLGMLLLLIAWHTYKSQTRRE